MVGTIHTCARSALPCVASSHTRLRRQLQMPTAVLEGIVQDVSGGVLANAAVELRELATNQRRQVSTDSQGFFRFTDVPVGTYEVRVMYDRFEPYGTTESPSQSVRRRD